ncbi:hypothetical protein M2137_001849 [Parabacteroides sp. PFB2-10]|nr:hypothetical protein [Parabacteroides sp. PFB2-10]
MSFPKGKAAINEENNYLCHRFYEKHKTVYTVALS